MKIVDALKFMNPVTTAEVTARVYQEMSEQKFRALQEDMLARAQRFSEAGDVNFSGSLTEGEMVMYASACDNFARSLQKARQKRGEIKIIASMALAEVVAWWHLLENVRSISVESD